MRNLKMNFNFPNNIYNNEDTEKNFTKNKSIIRKEIRPRNIRKIHVSDPHLISVIQNTIRDEENFSNQLRGSLKNQIVDVKETNQKYGDNKFNQKNLNGIFPTSFHHTINNNILPHVNNCNKENYSLNNLPLNDCSNTAYGTILNYNKFTNLMHDNIENVNCSQSYNIGVNSRNNEEMKRKNTNKIMNGIGNIRSVPEHFPEDYKTNIDQLSLSCFDSSDDQSTKKYCNQNFITIIDFNSKEAKTNIPNILKSETDSQAKFMNSLLKSNKENKSQLNQELEKSISEINMINLMKNNILNENCRNYHQPNNIDPNITHFNPFLVTYPQNPINQNNIFINTNITNLNFRNYPQNYNEEFILEIDDSLKKFRLEGTNNINHGFNQNRNYRKYSNNNSNQNSQVRNQRLNQASNNIYQNEKIQIKGNGYNYNYLSNSKQKSFRNNPNKFNKNDFNSFLFENVGYNNCKNQNFNNYSNFYIDSNMHHIRNLDSFKRISEYNSNKTQEKFEALNIKIKLVNGETKAISIKRCDDFYKKSRDFCIEHNLPQKLIIPLSIKLHYAVNSINKVLNTNLKNLDKGYLSSLNCLWNTIKSKEIHDLNVKQRKNDESDMNSSTLSSISNIEEELNKSYDIDQYKLNRSY